MIGYITLGTADMERAKSFYMGLFEEKGAKTITDMGRTPLLVRA